MSEEESSSEEKKAAMADSKKSELLQYVEACGLSEDEKDAVKTALLECFRHGVFASSIGRFADWLDKRAASDDLLEEDREEMASLSADLKSNMWDFWEEYKKN